ncbi:transposable element Tcb2 transposase [Trichonephila clavipes]|nr:transposable element Tcb2 transposase [Trichonephila clavipes]
MKTRLRTPSIDQSTRRQPHRKKCTRIANCFIGRHPGTCSTFTRGLCVFSNHMKAPGSRTFGITAPITCAALDTHPSTPPIGVVPRTRKLDRSAMEPIRLYQGIQIQVVFSDKSRFNIISDDNRVRVWRPRGECLNPAFALQRHTAPTADVMVWVAITYNTRSALVLICGTMTAQWYVTDILQPHVLSLMRRLPGAIFQQDNARPLPQDCLRTVTTLP